MPGEVYAWPEGRLWLWTGTTGASAVPCYATDSTMRETHGAENIQNVSGVYRDVATGRRADVQIGALYCDDTLALQTMFSAETAVHVHMAHTALGVSAGRFLWTGFLDTFEIVGRERDLYRVRVSYHSNRWSSY